MFEAEHTGISPQINAKYLLLASYFPGAQQRCLFFAIILYISLKELIGPNAFPPPHSFLTIYWDALTIARKKKI